MPGKQDCLPELEATDFLDSYYECITACYGLEGEDVECITQCVKVHFGAKDN